MKCPWHLIRLLKNVSSHWEHPTPPNQLFLCWVTAGVTKWFPSLRWNIPPFNFDPLLLFVVPVFSSHILQKFIRSISWPHWLVGLESEMNNIFIILLKSPWPKTPLSRRSGKVDLPVACSCRPTSKASLSVWDLDVVKHVKYCETKTDASEVTLFCQVLASHHYLAPSCQCQHWATVKRAYLVHHHHAFTIYFNNICKPQRCSYLMTQWLN